MGGGAHHEVAALLLEGELARESLRLHRRAVLAADDHLGAWVLGNVQEKSGKSPRHVQQISGKCPRHVQEMSRCFPGNFRECPGKFR